jgi:peptidoglycan-N-acetylglucosamine deacetylase
MNLLRVFKMKRGLVLLGGVLWLGLMLVSLWQPAAYAQDDPTATPSPGVSTYHVIQQDETLYQIALDYGTTVEEILTANNITDPRFLEIGQRIVIPNAQGSPVAPLGTHIVQPGETLSSLALQYQMDTATLAELNHLMLTNRLYVGQVLNIPEGIEPRTNLAYYHVQVGDTAPYSLTLRYPAGNVANPQWLDRYDPPQ